MGEFRPRKRRKEAKEGSTLGSPEQRAGDGCFFEVLPSLVSTLCEESKRERLPIWKHAKYIHGKDEERGMQTVEGVTLSLFCVLRHWKLQF